MSGHSKWANIKHRKEKVDSKKAKIFTKIGREIAIIVKEGGADPESNNKLKDVIAKAKSSNMPNDNIERSIKKAAGELGNTNFEEIVYEGYGPSGVAVIVEVMTDNRNRTAGDLRHYFDKYGGNLGQTGCVSYLFDKKGVFIIEKTDTIDEDNFMMEVLESGAEDIVSEEEYYEIITIPEDFSNVREILEKKYEFIEAQIQMLPQNYIKLTNEDDIKKMEKLIDFVEDLDDVQNIYHNWE
ncbi:MAG: YebC/PmpR family DNA-binding transcriptional regulator [Clostridiales bacterium]